ncbi:MAG: glycosyltransferase family 4 protein [Chloroflexi bacterium]|nr:glycosyltransferase family 4 protein [Chloroflexota bacterium]
MHIGIDLTGLWRQRTGIFRYAASLTPALLSLDSEIEYTLFVRKSETLPRWHSVRPVRIVETPWRQERLSMQLWFPWVRRQLGLDAIHYPAFPPPLLQHRGMVASVHDLTVLRYPETMTLAGRVYWGPLLRHAARVARPVLVPTQSTRQDLLELTTADPAHIVITPYAADERFALPPSPELIQHLRDRWSLPGRFALAVGTLEPRKNLPRLFEALAFLQQRGVTVPLIVVGRPGWGNVIPGAVSKLPIQFTGHVTDEELVAFYHLASLFVYPSLYEGFGFPILEAFWAGCPVITSCESSLPEVAGDAAVLISPHDTAALASAIDELWQDRVSARRLAAAGQERVRQFSWETCARLTVAAYGLTQS